MNALLSDRKTIAGYPNAIKRTRNLVLVVRADPIICGHSTEARNLAEAAIEAGFERVHIVSYPLDVLEQSGLPLKPLETISPYSPGITVDRPEGVGDYKVVDGRLGYGVSGHLVDLLYRLPGHTLLMDLYLVPHGQMVMNAVHSFRNVIQNASVTTIGEAVGSDITNIVGNAVAEGRFGAAQLVLSNYLQHDLPVAVSGYTRDLIVEAGREVDLALDTDFEHKLSERIRISFPAIDTSAYTSIADDRDAVARVLHQRGLEADGYVMFLSRIAPAKGVDDLIEAWRASKLREHKKLVICGGGPMKDQIRQMSAEDPDIRVLDDVSDEEKGALMHASFAWCLPSKPRPEFTETFGIAVAEKMLAGGLGPVITTRTGGIPEASGGHCLEHEAGNVNDLCGCLDRAFYMTDTERRELSARAQVYALQFDRSAILANLMEKCAVTVG